MITAQQKEATIGIVLALAAIALSVYSGSRGIALVFYGAAIVLRVCFLFLSAKILGTKGHSWTRAVNVVGANAAIMMALAGIVELVGYYSGIPALIVFIVSIVLAFPVAMRVYRVSFTETLALYALAFAMFAIAFIILVLVFHAPLAGLVSGGMQ